MKVKITGPKGGTIAPAAPLAKLAALIPAYLKKWPKGVTVQLATKPAPAPSARDRVVSWARWGVAHEPQIHYAETRPIPVNAKPGTLPLTTDCSGFATLCYRWAGAADPNGQGYNGQGYTGTLLDHGARTPISKVKPGDLVVYGGGTGHHVAIVVQAGADPLTVSHGQEAGPQLIHVSEEAKYQPRGVTYLKFLP